MGEEGDCYSPSSSCKSTLDRLGRNVERLAPEFLEEIHGIADGCNLSFEEISAYNCLTEMVNVPTEGCTNFAFADTEEGPVIAKTNDANMPNLAWFYFIEHIHYNNGAKHGNSKD